MQGKLAFRPLGEATIIPGDTVAPTGVKPAGPNRDNDHVSYLVSNPSAVDAYMGWGDTAAIAQTNSVIPTAGTPQRVVYVPAKSVQVLRFPDASFFSAITAAGQAGLILQMGDGL